MLLDLNLFKVDPVPTDALSQIERNQRTSEWVQNIDQQLGAANNGTCTLLFYKTNNNSFSWR